MAAVIKLRLTVGDSNAVIETKFLRAIATHLTGVFKRAMIAVRRRAGEVCESLIKRTDEYKSLLSGQLLGELGIPDVDRRLDAMLRTIRDSIEVNSRPFIRVGGRLQGGITVSILPADYADILGIPAAAYKTEKGTTIPWLEWLLTMGDRIVVIGYDVDLDLSPAERARSRTGLALMEKGSGWRLPPEFGPYVPEDNFLTRAFRPQEVEALFLEILMEEVVGRL